MNNINFERAAIFRMLQGNADVFTSALTLEAFTDDFCRHAFELMARRVNDFASLAKDMPKEAEAFLDLSLSLLDLTDTQLVESLNELRLRRHTYSTAAKLMLDCQVSAKPLGESLREHEQALAYAYGGENAVALVDAVRDVLENPKASLIETGFRQIDGRISMAKKELHTIFGLPATRKTALALNMALNCVEKGHSVVYFSIEDGVRNLAARIISARSGVPLWRFRHGLHENDYQAIMVHDWLDRLHICETAYTPQDILGVCLKLKPDVVIVDNASFVEVKARNGEVERANMIGEAMMRLAKKADTCVILLAHAPKDSLEHTPRQENVYGGMGLAKPSVSMLEMRLDPEWAERMKAIPAEQRYDAAIPIQAHVVKNRNGAPGGFIGLDFDGRTMKFYERGL